MSTKAMRSIAGRMRIYPFQWVVCVLVLLSTLPSARAQKTQLMWYGQSAFKITTPSGKVLLIDPWITNPTNATGKADLEGLKHVDLILITHAHFDHVGDTVAIAKQSGAHLVATSDLGQALVQYEGFPKAQAGMDTLGNCGGSIKALNGEVTITFVPAVHGSGLAAPEPTGLVEGGNPVGYVIQIKNGPVIYHTGDTDLFGDMALIPHIAKISVMLCCIGDHFTMGPSRAAEAVKLVHPGLVVPMHFGTFPILSGTPTEFAKDLAFLGVKTPMKVMQRQQPLSL